MSTYLYHVQHIDGSSTSRLLRYYAHTALGSASFCQADRELRYGTVLFDRASLMLTRSE